LQIIAWFSDITKNDNQIVGGKGCNLGVMYNIKLPVPPGFVVTTQAYKYFVENTGIQNKILNVVKDLDVEDTEKLQKASNEIQEIILDAQMPREIKTAVIGSYEDLNVDRAVSKVISNNPLTSLIKTGRELPFVAVRSSANAEDQESISENDFVFVKLNDKPFFGRMKELASIIKSDDQIYVPAMDNFNVEWKKASHLYKHRVDKKLFKLTTSTGKQITISANHTLIVLDEENLQPKVIQISELKSGEKLPVIKSLPSLGLIQDRINVLDYINNKDIVEKDDLLMIKSNNSHAWKKQQSLPKYLNINKEFAYFLGLYAAEGATYGNSIIISNSNSKIIENASKFMDSLGINTNIKINKHSIRYHCKTLVRFLDDNSGIPDNKIKGKGKTCYTKQVPSFLFSCPNEIIGEYLKGYFDGDGTIGKTVSCSSTSEKLIAGISTLLELLGIEFYISEEEPIRKNWHKKWIISLPLKELNKYSKSIGFLHNEKLKKLNTTIKNYNSTKKHFDLKNSIKVSDIIRNKIRNSLEDNLTKTEMTECLCPLCSEVITKTSRYKTLERYYCYNCKKTFYESNVTKRTIKKYVNYDNNGRFAKNSVPYNKSINTYPNYGLSKFKELVMRNGTVQIAEPLFSDTIFWDEIIKIDEVDCDSYVYDFSVPSVENFSSGLGGIITHNSASFAGQQATYLNVKGREETVLAVQKCWASLFTARAIYYRKKNNILTENVFIAVVIQRMVNSEKSGVMFSINPATNNQEEIMIEAAFGLGEVVVGGEVTPDTYIVDKSSLQIKSKKTAKQEYGLYRDQYTGKNVKKNLSEYEGTKQKLSEDEIIGLAKYGKSLEEYYGKPMDSEWAIENNKIYLVQTRPVTTLNKHNTQSVDNTNIGANNSEKILEGMGASPGVGKGKVKIVYDMDHLDKVETGDVLVTRMTTPDFVPAMRKAIAIVTDEGGLTSHAAIVSREMGIPCVVATEKATQILHDNDIITVDGTNGIVYRGEVNIVTETSAQTQEQNNTQEKVLNANAHEEDNYITGTKIMMNLGEPEKMEQYKSLHFDGIGLMRIEFIITDRIGKHPLYMIQQGRQQEYIDKLAEGIEIVAKEINPRPLIVRFSDFKTNEYKNLEGGSNFEPHEENPLIGWRGVSRYISPEFVEAFKLEIKAIKKLREQGLKNIHVMLPFVRNTDEVRKCLKILEEFNLINNHEFRVYLMAEVPAISIIPEEFAELPIYGASIGSNDLTMGILGIDRDSAKLGKMGYFDERNPAVMKAMSNIIRGFKKHNKTVSICGQCVSEYPEIVEFLIKEGIDSVSVNPDVVNKTRRMVASIERNILLGKVRGY